MEGADLVEGLLDDREDVLMSSASRLAWLVLYRISFGVFGIASYVRIRVASWLCTKLTKACVKRRSLSRVVKLAWLGSYGQDFCML